MSYRIITAYLMLIFGLGLNYIFSVLVARQYGVENFGNYSYALYIFNIVALIAVAGLDEASIKFIPQNKETGKSKTTIQTLSIFTSILFFIIYFLLIELTLSGHKLQMSYVLLLCLPLFVLLTVNTSILQAEYIVGPRMAFRHGLEPVVKMLSLIVLTFLAVGVLAPVYAMLIAFIVTGFVMLMVYRKRLIFFGFQFSIERFTEILRFILPMSINNIVNVAASRMDVIILGIVASSTQVGYYSAAFQTAAILSIVLQGLETVYSPLYSKSIGENNISELEKNLKQSLRWTMLIAAPLVLLFIIYPELALSPFGNNFKDSVNVFLILCVGQIINLATGSANTVLISLGQTKIVLLNSFVTGVILVAGVSWAAEYYGSIGAAVAVSIAILIMNCLRLYFLYRCLKITPFDIHYGFVMMALLVVAVIGIMTKEYLWQYVGLLIYPALVYLIVIVAGIHNDDKKIVSFLFNKIRSIFR